MFEHIIQSVIFDLDCTLADRRRSIDAYLEHFLERFGKLLKTSDPQTVRDVLGQADGNGYSADTRAADIVNALDWTRKPQAKVVDKHWHTSFPGCTVAMEDATEVLIELREEELSLGLVTNGSVLAQEAKIAHLGLEALDADAEDAVYVGDHPVNDVQDATDAGLTAIWMRGWQDWPTDMPPTELLVDRLAEVPPMLASL